MRKRTTMLALLLAATALATASAEPRIDTQGGVVVELTLHDTSPEGVLTWEVMLETHAGDLRPLDLDRRAVLRTEAGDTVPATFSFDVTADSAHHPAGTLTLDLASVDAASLRTLTDAGPVLAFDLVLHDVGGVPERSFSWAVPVAEEAPGLRAYVANAGDGSISVIDLASFQEVDRWNVGDEASHGLALLPDDRTLYVGTGAEGAILALDTRDGTVTRRIDGNVNAHGIDATPDGRYVFVGAGGTNDTAHLLRIDTRDGKETHLNEGLDPVGHIDVSPDGTRAYVANLATDTLTVLDTETLALLARIPVGDGPNESRVTPDGSTVLVANWASSDVSVIDAATSEVVRTLTVGDGTHGVAITPAGDEAWIVNRLSNDVAVIDLRSWTVTERLEAAEYANHITFTPDGATALVTNARANELSVFDVANRTLLAIVPVGTEPHEVTVGRAVTATRASAGEAR